MTAPSGCLTGKVDALYAAQPHNPHKQSTYAVPMSLCWTTGVKQRGNSAANVGQRGIYICNSTMRGFALLALRSMAKT